MGKRSTATEVAETQVTVEESTQEETVMTSTQVLEKAIELNNSVEEVNKAIKKNAAAKCRLNKMPGRSDYQAKMDAVLEEEALLKMVKDYLQGPRKTVNTLTSDSISEMDYDATCRAIRSIQSKKTHTRWADDCEKDENGLYIPGSGASYKEACRIEELLKAHRAELQPTVAVKLTKVEYDVLAKALSYAFEQYSSSNGEIDPCELDQIMSADGSISQLLEKLYILSGANMEDLDV